MMRNTEKYILEVQKLTRMKTFKGRCKLKIYVGIRIGKHTYEETFKDDIGRNGPEGRQAHQCKKKANSV